MAAQHTNSFSANLRPATNANRNKNTRLAHSDVRHKQSNGIFVMAYAAARCSPRALSIDALHLYQRRGAAKK